MNLPSQYGRPPIGRLTLKRDSAVVPENPPYYGLRGSSSLLPRSGLSSHEHTPPTFPHGSLTYFFTVIVDVAVHLWGTLEILALNDPFHAGTPLGTT